MPLRRLQATMKHWGYFLNATFILINQKKIPAAYSSGNFYCIPHDYPVVICYFRISISFIKKYIMKNSFFTCIFCISGLSIQAQHLQLPYFNSTQTALQQNENYHPASKTNDITAYRLAEYTVDWGEFGGWMPAYHYSFNYSGERSGSYNHNLYPFFRGDLNFDVSNETDIVSPEDIPEFQKTRTYNSENLVTEELNKSWNATTMIFDNYQQEIFEYTDGLLSKKTKNEWNTSVYEPAYEMEYTYTGSLLSTRLEKIYSGGSFENKEQTFFSYNPDESFSNVLVQVWNGISWDDYLSYTYTYDTEGNCTEILITRNFGSGLEDWYKLIYTYSAGNILEHYELKLYVSGVWENYEFTEVEWDGNGNLLELKILAWSAIDYINSARYSFVYEEYTITATEEIQAPEISVSPNPANEYIQINASENMNAIKLFSPDGKLLVSKNVSGKQYKLSLADLSLPSGFYFLQLQTENDITTAKIIKQ